MDNNIVLQTVIKKKYVKPKDSYSKEEVRLLLHRYAVMLGQRDGQTLPTISPLKQFYIDNKL